mgnify:CR=1 FL=1
MAQLKITLVRSVAGTSQRQRGTLGALGLKKLNQAVVKEDTPVIRGMLAKVRHLVRVEQG